MNTLKTSNAGQRLLDAQVAQGSNLCIGLDPHFETNGLLNQDFYSMFSTTEVEGEFSQICHALHFREIQQRALPKFLSGVVGYFREVINTAWHAGARVFKPNVAFYEQFAPFGQIMLQIICRYIHDLGRANGGEYFIIIDAKRGDIGSTQVPYYAAYLTSHQDEVLQGLLGQYDADAMTVTTWMGISVLEAGLNFFKAGKGAVVVTRSSNPDGTALQDATFQPSYYDDEDEFGVELSEEQQAFVLSDEEVRYNITDAIDRVPTIAEVMMYLTEKFCTDNALIENGVSPIFSVIGSTVVEDGTFRKLRPSGVALVPGFGAQGGNFANAMPMLDPETGQGAIFSSSRGHNYAWMQKYGGNNDPENWGALGQAIDDFRTAEKAAYKKAKILYPYA